jgi:hypothetical protein
MAAEGAKRLHLLSRAARSGFLRNSTVAHVENDAVSVYVEAPVERHGQLDRAQVRGQMTAVSDTVSRIMARSAAHSSRTSSSFIPGNGLLFFQKVHRCDPSHNGNLILAYNV